MCTETCRGSDNINVCVKLHALVGKTKTNCCKIHGMDNFKEFNVTFEVLRLAVLKFVVFWDVMMFKKRVLSVSEG
jgi:hypothetical protein